MAEDMLGDLAPETLTRWKDLTAALGRAEAAEAKVQQMQAVVDAAREYLDAMTTAPADPGEDDDGPDLDALVKRQGEACDRLYDALSALSPREQPTSGAEVRPKLQALLDTARATEKQKP